MNLEIEECPFCGGIGAVKNDAFRFFVKCKKCGAEGPSRYRPNAAAVMKKFDINIDKACDVAWLIAKARAVKSWNERV